MQLKKIYSTFRPRSLPGTGAFLNIHAHKFGPSNRIAVFFGMFSGEIGVVTRRVIFVSFFRASLVNIRSLQPAFGIKEARIGLKI